MEATVVHPLKNKILQRPADWRTVHPSFGGTKKSNINILIALCLIGLGISLRLLPHPANFAPITAIALFGGAVLPRRWGLWVPLAAMILTDAVIGFHDLILITWGFYAVVALVASHWLKKPTLLKGVTLTFGSSLVFFLVSNFAVWVSSGMYEHTLSGLVRCFELALPFFRNTFLSDVIYTAALFGLYALATKLSYRLLKTTELSKI